MLPRVVLVRVGVAFALIFGFCGCAGGTDVVLEMHDFYFEPTDVTVGAGEPITIEVVNDGDGEHDPIITKGVFELSLEAQDAIGGGSGDRCRFVGSAGARRGPVHDVDGEPGEYQYFCNVFGHFYQGMTGTITVEP